MNNLHNMTKKNLFDGYVGPPPVLSRYYSTKANPSQFPGSPLLTMNNYLSNVGHFGKRSSEIRTHRNENVRAEALKMPPLVSRGASAYSPLVQIVGGFVGSKSQAGCTNLRGREFSLWDVIVDKFLEIMEQPAMPKPLEMESKRTEHGGGRNLGSVGDFILAPFGYETSENRNWRSECPDFQQEKATNNRDNIPPETMPFSSYDSPISIGNAIDPRTCMMASSTETLVPCSPLRSLERPSSVGRTLNLPDEEPIADDSGRGTPSNLETHSLAECLNVDLLESAECLPEQSISEVTSWSSPQPEKESSPTIADRDDGSTGELSAAVLASPVQTPSSGNVSFSGSRLSFTSDSDDCDANNTSPALSSSCDSGSMDNFFPRRILAQRTLSECSVESDDSFIVFDCIQDDPSEEVAAKSKDTSATYFEFSIQASEDSGDESDSDLDLDEIDHYILFSRNTDTFQPEPYLSRCDEANRKWNSFYGMDSAKENYANRLPKKVKFAQDKDLIKVRRLVAWDFAHRAARVGPWEMYYRDSERFKRRIANYSTVLSPILGASHRARIYSERFQDPT